MYRWLVRKQDERELVLVPLHGYLCIMNSSNYTDDRGITITIGEARKNLAEGRMIFTDSFVLYLNKPLTTYESVAVVDEKMKMIEKKTNYNVAPLIYEENSLVITPGTKDTLMSDFCYYVERMMILYGLKGIGELMAASVLLINKFETDINKILAILMFYDKRAGENRVIKNGDDKISLTQYIRLNANAINARNYGNTMKLDVEGDFDSATNLVIDLCKRNKIEIVWIDTNKECLQFVKLEGKFEDIRIVDKDGGRLNRIL